MCIQHKVGAVLDIEVVSLHWHRRWDLCTEGGIVRHIVLGLNDGPTSHRINPLSPGSDILILFPVVPVRAGVHCSTHHQSPIHAYRTQTVVCQPRMSQEFRVRRDRVERLPQTRIRFSPSRRSLPERDNRHCSLIRVRGEREVGHCGSTEVIAGETEFEGSGSGHRQNDIVGLVEPPISGLYRSDCKFGSDS